MNKNLAKFGMTLALISALSATSVVTFADTAVTSAANTATGLVKHFGGDSVLDRLLKDGVVTQAQIDKVKAQMDTERLDTIKTALQKLVTDGKLSQAKVDAFLKAEAEQKAAMDALKTKLDAMTEADRQAYLQKNDPRANNAVQALVTNGTLTQADLLLIHQTIGMGGHGMGGPGMGGHGGKGGHGMGGRGMGGPEGFGGQGFMNQQTQPSAPATGTSKGL